MAAQPRNFHQGRCLGFAAVLDPMDLVEWVQVQGRLPFTRHTSHSCHQFTGAGVSIFDPWFGLALPAGTTSPSLQSAVFPKKYLDKRSR